MPLLDFVTSVQPADPNIVIVFAAMINKSEVENILTDDEHREALKIFNPSQLLKMLEVIAQQSSKVDHVTMFLKPCFFITNGEGQQVVFSGLSYICNLGLI